MKQESPGFYPWGMSKGKKGRKETEVAKEKNF